MYSEINFKIENTFYSAKIDWFAGVEKYQYNLIGKPHLASWVEQSCAKEYEDN